VSLNVTNDTGDTPLHKAAFVGRTDIVQLLLAHNADVSIRNEELRTARQLARSSPVADLLAQVEQSDRRRRETRFLQSARDGDMETLRSLLTGALAVNVNCADECGNTALHGAAVRAQKQVIAFLLQQPGIDLSAKNKSGQIPATLAPNNALKRLLLHVQPIHDPFSSAAGAAAFGSSTTSRLPPGQPDRFEGALLRRSRFVVWRRVWAVLDRGGLALYANQSDAAASKRRLQFAFLHAATLEPSEAGHTLSLQLDQRVRLVLQVPSTPIPVDGKQSTLATCNETLPIPSGNGVCSTSPASLASSSPLSSTIELRRIWCEAIDRHIEFARRLVARGVCIELDSEDETLPADRISLDNAKRTTSEDRVQNLLDTAHAHLGVLQRHLRGLKQLVEEDLQHVQSTLPDGLSVECSRAVMHCMKRFWPTLTFHLNFVQESAHHTNDALQHCVNVMDRQYKVK
jgi:hypothetical protein